MRNGVYKKLRRISNIIVALWLIIPMLITAVGMLAFLSLFAWHWTLPFSGTLADILSAIGVLLACTPPLGVGGLCVGAYILVSSLKCRRLMKTLGVNKADISRFEREYRHGERMRFGKILITDHWLFNYYPERTCLAPLEEVEWLRSRVSTTSRKKAGGGYEKTRWTDWHLGIELGFSNGATLYVKCEPGRHGSLMRELAERCPGAEARRAGTTIF